LAGREGSEQHLWGTLPASEVLPQQERRQAGLPCANAKSNKRKIP
jgi:hypothetical protein